MSRYYDYTNGISWQNQQMAGSQGVGAGKEGGRPQPPMYSPHPAYTSAAQDSRVNLPIAPRNNLYAQSMYHQYQQQAAKPQAPPIPSYPVLPDVKLKRLPFYDNLGEVMKPSSLLPTTTQRIQESVFTFYLSPQQATSVATGRDYVGVSNKLDNIVQVQLRFCLVETTSEQEDHFPPSCGVKINGKICPLPSPIPTNKPGVEPKRPPRPVNITALLKLCPTVPNNMNVSWATDFTKNYALNVTLVRKLTSAELLSRLKSKGTKPSDFTRSLIKEKLREDLDSEIATTSLRVSLVCPLGKMRMSCPCRPVTCGHLQCFDGSLFLQMNERKPTWLCPVCDKPAVYDSLVVDGYFQEVLNSPRLGADCCEVQLLKDGSWSAHIPKKETENIMTPIKDVKAKVEVISDDLDIIPLSDGSNSSGGPVVAKRSASPTSPAAAPADPNAAPSAGNQSVVDLTSDDDDDMPLRKKNYPESQHAEHAKYNDVSSSGYASPSPPAAPVPPASIISLDSPSPPPAPASPPSLPLPLPAHQASVARPSLWTPPLPPLQHRY